ncbi:UDP-N-acetylglucosamine 2-epimerase [Bacteroidota bacterium]
MRIAIFTTTRAEFGIFIPLINAINQCSNLEHLLFVGGTHLSTKYGYTIEEIKKEGFPITDTFNYVTEKTAPFDLLKSTANEITELARIFNDYKFDAICVLGDRYELLPIVMSAILYQKAVIHIHGGERSEGTIDEQVRHMITKAAHIHFASCEEYAQNIQKMGESSWRVFNTGALAVDNMKNIKQTPKDILFNELKLNPSKDLAILTYHPVTLEKKLSPTDQIKNIFLALRAFDVQIIITAPNLEADRDEILKEIMKFVEINETYHFVESLGTKRYLNLISHCKFVIGNSSSGIIEVPFFKVPTINIGNRQKGRIKHKSVIDTDYFIESIKAGIIKALDKDFIRSIEKMKYIFGSGNTAKKMVEILQSTTIDQKFIQKELDFPC